jgi:hypothetical protein
VISGVAVVVSSFALACGVLGWYESKKTRRKTDDALRLARNALVHKSGRDEQERIRELKMRCALVCLDMDNLKKLYNSIQVAANGRVTDASVVKMHNKIDKRVASVDSITNYLANKIIINDRDLTAMEQKVFSIERYAVDHRMHAYKSLDTVISRRSRLRLVKSHRIN